MTKKNATAGEAPEPPTQPPEPLAKPLDRPMVEYALEYAARGLAVFPINPETKLPDWRLVPTDRDTNGEKIRGTGGVKKATKDPDAILRWWSRQPLDNIGLALGEPSGGIVAFDEDGEAERSLLADAGLAGLTSTLESKSGRASREGRHVFFKASGEGLRNRTVSDGGIRGNGYYVVAPPSLHKSGRRYTWTHRQWLDGPADLSELPQALIDQLDKLKGNVRPRGEAKAGG